MNDTSVNDLIGIGLLHKDGETLSFAAAWLASFLRGGRPALSGELHLAGRWGPKAVLGLTGNIAVGKSTVLAMLADLGAEVINADQLVHVLREPGRPGYQAILDLFGPEMLLSDGRIDTRRLSERAFQDKGVMRQLEQVFRPLVVDEVIRLGRVSLSPVVVIEALYLVDGTLKDQVDQVWVVDASQERQIERLVAHRGLTTEQAIRRIEAQAPQANKLALADTVIQNDADVAFTWEQVLAGWWPILRDLYGLGWLTDDLLAQTIQAGLDRAGSELGSDAALKVLRQLSAAMGTESRLPLAQVEAVLGRDNDPAQSD